MRFSIITINLNNKEGLRKTIESVLTQTYSDFEYIIIDGDSTDGSKEIIYKVQKHLSYWVTENDNGIYNAMNKGVLHANGEYCIFINSGDTLYNNYVLENVSKYTEDIFVGKVFGEDRKTQLFIPPKTDITLYNLFSGTIAHQGSFIKTSLLRQFPFDETLKIVSDWKFYIETVIIHNCSIKFIEEKVSIFDTNGVSTSNPERTYQEKMEVINTVFPKRIIADYQRMKNSECLVQEFTPRLRKCYMLDRLIAAILRKILK